MSAPCSQRWSSRLRSEAASSDSSRRASLLRRPSARLRRVRGDRRGSARPGAGSLALGRADVVPVALGLVVPGLVCGLRCVLVLFALAGLLVRLLALVIHGVSLGAHRRVSTPLGAVAMRVPRRRCRVQASVCEHEHVGAAREWAARARPSATTVAHRSAGLHPSAVSLQGLPLFLITSTLDGPVCGTGWLAGGANLRGHQVRNEVMQSFTSPRAPHAPRRRPPAERRRPAAVRRPR